MKRKPRWTLEILTGALAVLCGLLFLVLLVQRPAGWPVLVVLVVLWGIGMGLFRYRLRSWLARWVTGGSFENSKTQYSLESLSQPAAVLSGETVLWYNTAFRQRLLGGEDRLASRAQKLLPGLDLQLCRTADGQQLNLADGVWSIHSSTVPGQSESVTLLIFNEETALRRVEAEYKASRPGYMVFLVDGYDDVFSDMLDSERARLLEGINRVLEDLIGRGTGFLRRVASGRYIAVVEERHLEQYAKRGYDVLDKIRALDPSVNLSITCIEMELGEPDASGRRRPIEKKGSEFELDVDTVIMSLGTSPNPLIRSTTPGLETNKHGCIVTDGDDGKTSRDGVYAGGDAVTGAATVIKAMGAGKAAAKAIDEYIQNK